MSAEPDMIRICGILVKGRAVHLTYVTAHQRPMEIYHNTVTDCNDVNF